MKQPPRIRECDHCYRRFPCQRTPTRYCSGRCRVAAFRQRQEQLAVEAARTSYGLPLPRGYIPRSER